MRPIGSLLSGLVDLSFTRLITVRLMRVMYPLSLVAFMLGGAGLIALAVETMPHAIWRGIGMLLGALITVVGGAIGSRVACETIIVVFRLAEHAAEMADQTATIATNTAVGATAISMSRR